MEPRASICLRDAGCRFLSPAKFLPHYSTTVKCSLGLPQCGDIFLWFHGPFPESVPMAPKDTPTQLRPLNSFPKGEPPGSSPYNFLGRGRKDCF